MALVKPLRKNNPAIPKHNLDGIRLADLPVPFYLDPLVCEARLDGKLSKKAV